MIKKEIEDHAKEVYPRESVGYVSEGRYLRLINTSKVPEKTYSLSTKDLMKMYTLKSEGKLTALVHSHPLLDNNPSKKDLEAHSATKFNFYIIGTDGKLTTEIRRIIHE